MTLGCVQLIKPPSQCGFNNKVKILYPQLQPNVIIAGACWHLKAVIVQASPAGPFLPQQALWWASSTARLTKQVLADRKSLLVTWVLLLGTPDDRPLSKCFLSFILIYRVFIVCRVEHRPFICYAGTLSRFSRLKCQGRAFIGYLRQLSTHYVAQVGFYLVILLPQPSE